MLDSLFIGTSGLQAYSKALKVISNNVANLNTPGFKSSSLQFAAQYYQQGGSGLLTGGHPGQAGTGVATLSTFINFKDGDTRQTGNPLDLSIDGQGFFIGKDARSGDLTYTRAGQFQFSKDGVLLTRGTERQVMGYGKDGGLGAITLDGLRSSAPKATSVIKFSGNLSTGSTEFSVDAVKIIDAAGATHTVRLVFKPKAGENGAWSITLVEDAQETPAGTIKFLAGTPVAGSEKTTLQYTPAGLAAQAVVLDFSKDVTAFSAGTDSTLGVASSDGQEAGTLTQASFDAAGVLNLKYTNGATATGAQLALATFESFDGLLQDSAGGFSVADPRRARLGRAGTTGHGGIASNKVEVSNVDLSTEFSDLIVMQRGYQASSRIVSTANDMLQELFDMKGSR